MVTAAQIDRRARADEAKLAGLGIVIARKITARIKQKVMHSFRRGQQVDLRNMVVSGLGMVVVDSMVAMHLAGEQMQRRIALEARRAISFSAESELQRLLAKLATSERRKALAKRYSTSALNVLNGVGARVETSLRKTVNELIVDGAPLGEGIKALGEKFDELGLSPKHGYQLETIFRTQSQVAYGAGRWQADQDPEIQSILWGYEYSTVGDDRVRPEHKALDGVRLPKDDPFWKRFWPPNGWSCRCTVIPIFDEVEIKRAPLFVPGTETPVQPDPDFNFNAGLVLAV